MKDFNLHTIVRLPEGVFSPYTGIPTNIIFFDRTGPSKEIWYYEIPGREGGGRFSKSKPMQYEEFAECIEWWKNKKENACAWKVMATDILANGCNLDRRNPSAIKDFEHMPPEKLMKDLLSKEKRILEVLADIQTALEQPKR